MASISSPYHALLQYTVTVQHGKGPFINRVINEGGEGLPKRSFLIMLRVERDQISGRGRELIKRSFLITGGRGSLDPLKIDHEIYERPLTILARFYCSWSMMEEEEGRRRNGNF